MDGPILKDKQDGKYEIVAVVRRTFLIEENPIFYFYTDYVMDWKVGKVYKEPTLMLLQ